MLILPCLVASILAFKVLRQSGQIASLIETVNACSLDHDLVAHKLNTVNSLRDEVDEVGVLARTLQERTLKLKAQVDHMERFRALADSLLVDVLKSNDAEKENDRAQLVLLRDRVDELDATKCRHLDELRSDIGESSNDVRTDVATALRLVADELDGGTPTPAPPDACDAASPAIPDPDPAVLELGHGEDD